MKTILQNIYNLGFFTLIVFALFLGSSTTVFGQTTITLNVADNVNSPVTIPLNATSVTVEIWGSGGSGGAGETTGGGKNSVDNGAGGGGGGAYSRSINILPGDYNFAVGTGGGSTSFGTLSAGGGSAGADAVNGGTGGIGGISNGNGNDENLSGVDGNDAVGAQAGDGGAGANGGAGGLGGNSSGGGDGSALGGGGGGGSGRNNLGGAGADGQIIITYTLSAVAPTITLTNANPSVVQGTISANIIYSSTTGTPTTYSIIYDATALGQGFSDVSGIALTDPIVAIVPSGAAIDVYNGTLTVNNGQESIGYPITIEVTAPVVPTITLGLSPSVAQGITSADLPYTATTGSPTTYSITYDATALGASFSNVTDALLPASPILLNVPLSAPLATYNGTLTVSNGQVSSGYSFTITVTAPIPTITLTDANPSVVQGTTSANITYSATFGSPTTYSIDYNLAAESAGFSDVSGIALGSSIVAVVPSGASLTTYNGTLTVNNGQESSGYAITITVTAPPPPTIILGSYPSVLQGTTLANLSYTATANPTSYSITYDAAAISAGFSNITNALLPASPILLNVPPAAPFAAYNAILTVSNGQVSPNYSFTITIKEIQGHSLTNCSSCHITHSSPGTSLTSVAGNALLCQSCHISTGEASAKPLVDGNKAIPGASGNSHSWDVPATNPTYQTLAPAATTEMGMRLPGGNIICSTCHDQHNDGNAGSPYLRIDNTGDAMCKVCHSVRDVQLFQNGPTNKGSHPVGVPYNAVAKLNASPTSTLLVGSNVECSSCHGVHDVTNSGEFGSDGNLLRMPKGNSLCMDCHNYPTHNGFDCLDCHEVHNTVDGIIGDNIYMIRDVVNGSPVKFYAESGVNSFVDKDGIDDGICEVCHTATTHHLNDGSGITHNDASDKREQSCVGCHFHNAGFETPSGPLTCVGCHSSAQPGGRGGVVQIVGATIGEMNNTLSSRHTSSGIGIDPLNEECEACHYDNGTTHPTSTMMLRDPDAAAVWSGDVDVYCVKCHDGNAPITPADFSYINTTIYNKASYVGTPHDNSANSCLGCHERHGSQNAALTMQATNYENCFACHDGNTASTTISAANIAIPGTSGNGHAFNVSASSGLYETNIPSDPAMAARLDSGNIVCSTCHDPHANTNGKLLVSPNSADEMCKDCHLPRDKGTYAADPINNIGSHPVGIAYPATTDYNAGHTLPLISSNVECSSCHGVHDVAGSPLTTDGNLLKMTNDNNLCKDCHAYQPHQGFECLDCHQAHNGTNIMLIKNQIDIDLTAGVDLRSVTFSSQNSFIKGAGANNGICEVCHTSTSYHTNIDDGTDHNDGANCTGCHSHNGYPPLPDPQIITSFPQGSCHSCHETPDDYPNTGAHAIHAGAPYYYACSTCHLDYGDGGSLEGVHSNGTTNVAFDLGGLATRNGQDAITPTWDYDGSNPATKTCSNVYCHSNGMSADRGTDQYDPILGLGPDNNHDWAGGTITPTIPFTGNPAILLTYETTPRWDTGTFSTCIDACHKGPTAFPTVATNYDVTPGTSQEVVVGQHPLSGSHGGFVGQHDGNGNIGAWGASVQCFWCHDVDTRLGEGGIKKQGTYGTSSHIDGAVQFKVGEFGNGLGGTMVWEMGGKARARGIIGGHCNGQACWD
ncbi:CxxxxCH/CxxCH domain-containing protein [Lutibacter sp.]|uniref:cytochrome c3 family protein n=1 Tax=Lutibacter sp. TaxID=1925666 RepID=UPI0035676AA2